MELQIKQLPYGMTDYDKVTTLHKIVIQFKGWKQERMEEE